MAHTMLLLIAVFLFNSMGAQTADSLQSRNLGKVVEIIAPTAGEVNVPSKNVYPLLQPSTGQHHTLRSGEYFSFGNPMEQAGFGNYAHQDSTHKKTTNDTLRYNGILVDILLDQIMIFTLEPKDFRLKKQELENPSYKLRKKRDSIK